MSDLTPTGENEILFGNTFKSDGFSVDLVFYRRQKKKHDSGAEFALKDFNYEEIRNQYQPTFLDPGRKSLFTAVVGLEPAKQIRRASTKEYYHLTGSTVYSKKLESKKERSGVRTIESQIPTPKTTEPENFRNYVTYILANLDTLLKFYGKETSKYKFQLYQGRQRAPEMMVNMLTHGTAKYNKSKRKKKGRKNMKRGKKKKKEPKMPKIQSKDDLGLKSKLDTAKKK